MPCQAPGYFLFLNFGANFVAGIRMTFWKRLRFYGIGFAMGLLVIYAMFGTRSCVTPNEMKMQELVFQHFELGEKARCKLRCMKMNEMLLKIHLRHFRVNYDLSEVHKQPCGAYFVEPQKEHAAEYQYRLLMLDCDTITRIDDISVDNLKDCGCQ